MPEGDTIRRLAAGINDRFAGQTITASMFRHPRLATASLADLKLSDADARGKHLLLRFSDGRSLQVHLLVQGRVVFGPAFDIPDWRRRFELTLQGGRLTGIDIPKLDLIRTRDEPSVLGHLGPDLCGVYDHDLAVARLRTAGADPLGAALLNQQLIAGFGNIYAVETPFICGISPFQPVESIDDLYRVVAVGAALIRTNAQLGPQRTTGQARQRSLQWILPNSVRRCPVCGARTTRYAGAQSPWRRRLGVCPTCQPLRPTVGVDLDRVRSLMANHPAARILDLEGGGLTVATDAPVEVRVGASK